MPEDPGESVGTFEVQATVALLCRRYFLDWAGTCSVPWVFIPLGEIMPGNSHLVPLLTARLRLVHLEGRPWLGAAGLKK